MWGGDIFFTTERTESTERGFAWLCDIEFSFVREAHKRKLSFKPVPGLNDLCVLCVLCGKKFLNPALLIEPLNSRACFFLTFS